MHEKICYRLQVLHALIPFAGGVKRFLWMNLSNGVLAMMLGFVQPLFYRVFIDDVILRGQSSFMPMIVVGYVSLFLMNAAPDCVDTSHARTEAQIAIQRM